MKRTSPVRHCKPPLPPLPQAALLVLLAMAVALPMILLPATRSRADASAAIPRFTKVQSNYLLSCGGCHGETGISNSHLVPDLRDQVGYYLNSAIGRAYLVRLPNVAFSTLSNDELAEVLNFMVFKIGGNSAPKHAAPYTPAEVAGLRLRPLNEVSLLDYRTHLVDELIAQHLGSEKLRDYGSEAY